MNIIGTNKLSDVTARAQQCKVLAELVCKVGSSPLYTDNKMYAEVYSVLLAKALQE